MTPMLTKTENPVSWAMLFYELADAHEHLVTLMDQLTTDGEIDEPDSASSSPTSSPT